MMSAAAVMSHPSFTCFSTVHLYHTVTHTHNCFTAHLDFVQDYPGEPAPERQNQSGFTGARDSEWQWHHLGHMQNLHLDSDT